MADTQVTSVPPQEGIPKVDLGGDPTAKALADQMNQIHGEIVRQQREDLEAAGVKWSEKQDTRVTALEAKFANAVEEVTTLDTQLQALARAKSAASAAPSDGFDERDYRNSPKWADAFDSWARSGAAALPDAYNEILTQGNGFHEILERTPMVQQKAEGFDPRNAVTAGGLSTTWGPGAGVWARPQFENAVTRLLIEFSPIRSFARVTNISAGEFVGMLRTANRDTIEQKMEHPGAVGTQQTQLDRYEERRIRAFIYNARPGLSLETLEDSAIDIEGEVRDDVALDFAVDESSQFTTGSDANEPGGYASDSAVGGVTSRAASTLDHYDLMDLALSLRPFYRNSTQAAYAFSTTAFRLAALEEDGMGRRLWQPAMTDGTPSLLNGWRYFEATEQAAVASAAKPVFFANWREFYRIVDRVGLQITRDDITTPGLVILNMRRRYGGRTWKQEAGKALTIA
jgi:HK97 family phage major capsid protein